MGMTVDGIEDYWKQHWPAIREQLKRDLRAAAGPSAWKSARRPCGTTRWGFGRSANSKGRQVDTLKCPSNIGDVHSIKHTIRKSAGYGDYACELPVTEDCIPDPVSQVRFVFLKEAPTATN
jgi:hypothetical protein